MQKISSLGPIFFWNFGTSDETFFLGSLGDKVRSADDPIFLGGFQGEVRSPKP